MHKLWKQGIIREADGVYLLPMPGMRLQDLPEGQGQNRQAPEGNINKVAIAICTAMTAVLGYVLRGDCVLLIRRGTSPYKHSWSLPGGVAHRGESLEDACVREVKEETGLDVEVLREVGRVRSATPIFLCESTGGALRSRPPESVAVGWFPLEVNALPRFMPPFIREFLERHTQPAGSIFECRDEVFTFEEKVNG